LLRDFGYDRAERGGWRRGRMSVLDLDIVILLDIDHGSRGGILDLMEWAE
jgi:hypothetical protein